VFVSFYLPFSLSAIAANGKCEGLWIQPHQSPMTFSEWLQAQRLEKGYSQEEIGQAVGIDRSALSRLEHGVSGTVYELIAKLAYVFERPVEEPFIALSNQAAMNLGHEVTYRRISYEALSQRNIGAWLRFRRVQSGQSMVEAGQKVNGDHSAISRLESEAKDTAARDFFIPKPELLAKIAWSVDAPYVEPFLMIARRHQIDQVANDPSRSMFLETIEDIRNWVDVRQRRLPAIRAADYLENYLSERRTANKPLDMFTRAEDPTGYDLVLENLSDDLFVKNLKSAEAIAIHKEFLQGAGEFSTRREMLTAKEFDAFINDLTKPSEGNVARPRFPQGFGDELPLYRSLIIQIRKPSFLERLQNKDARMIASYYIEHLRLMNQLYPTVTKADAKKIGAVANDLYESRGGSVIDEAAKVFTAYIRRLNTSALPLQWPRYATHPAFYHYFFHVAQEPEFISLLPDQEAQKLAKAFQRNIEIYRIYRGTN
ncbi:MAG: helix-turn-helix transcriptional regulator, partial [Proteobacteria bacterium]|nr:helix-turn-helix transcriptional regulator [Pseudomonadota bacterium]